MPQLHFYTRTVMLHLYRFSSKPVLFSKVVRKFLQLCGSILHHIWTHISLYHNTTSNDHKSYKLPHKSYADVTCALTNFGL